jgi:hypothetical protein
MMMMMMMMMMMTVCWATDLPVDAHRPISLASCAGGSPARTWTTSTTRGGKAQGC